MLAAVKKIQLCDYRTGTLYYCTTTTSSDYRKTSTALLKNDMFEKVEKVHIIKSQMVYKILTFQVGNFRDVFGFCEVSPPMASRLKDCCG